MAIKKEVWNENKAGWDGHFVIHYNWQINSLKLSLGCIDRTGIRNTNDRADCDISKNFQNVS